MTRFHGSRFLRLAGVVAGLVLATSACFTAELGLDIRDDDTVDISYTLLFDVKVLAELSTALGGEVPGLAEASGEELLDELFEGEDPCEELATELPDRTVESTPVTEGDERGVRCTAAGVPLSELTSLGEDTSLRIDRNGSDTTIEIDLTGVTDLGDDTDVVTEELGLAVDELLNIRFVVSAPGTVESHNATTVNGSTLTWVITPEAEFVTAGNAQLRASWSGDDSGGSGLGTAAVVIAVLVVVFVAATITVVVISRRRRRETVTLQP